MEESTHNSSVTDSVRNPPLSLAVAEEKFSVFLASQNYPTATVWVFPGDVLVDRRRRYWIKSNPEAAREHAALSYENGVKRKLGICLRAICASETETFATVFAPEDGLDAQYNLMGRGLKLSCPVERFPASIATTRLKWLMLRLANGKRSKGLWL